MAVFLIFNLPVVLCTTAGARRERNNNKHKRLFTGGPGALQDGQALYYRAHVSAAPLRSGFAVINPNGVSGIKCDCCQQVRVKGFVTSKGVLCSCCCIATSPLPLCSALLVQ